MSLKRTPFHHLHEEHGARFVDFAGWEMPILYESIRAEHQRVREQAGFFDVSHMGRIQVKGRHARRFLERLLTRRITDMREKTCRYSLICNEQGGVRDDVLVYRFDDYWLLVVNASNREKILEHMRSLADDMSVKIEDQTESTAMVAVQGPKTMDVVGRFSKEIPTLKKYNFTVKNLLVLKMTVSRTGYTGEDGIEVILNANMASTAIKLLLKEDDEASTTLKPCGLGARDTLRMEAGMPLYGHELTEQIDPLSAGLDFAVSLDKDEQENTPGFVGQDALREIAGSGPSRRLVGLHLSGKRTPRQGMPVLQDAQTIGEVTSGCLSPTLGHPIAMAYVEAGQSEPGTETAVDFGRRSESARIVALPFYKRSSS